MTDTVDKVQQPQITTTLTDTYTNSHEVLDSFVELFDITLPGYDPGTGNGNYFLFSGLDDEGTTQIEFRQNNYSAIPIQITGIEVASSGAIARPTLTIANIPVLSKTIDNKEITLHNIRDPSIRGTSIDGTLNAEFETNDDLIGTKVVYRQAFLSDCNTNSATPNEFPPQVYYIDRIASESNIFVIFELASPMDVERAKIPARNVIGQYCPWQYQGRELGFGGGCTWRYTDSEQHSFFRSDNTRIPNASITTWNDTTSYTAATTTAAASIVKTTETTGPNVSAGNFVIGQLYKIVTTGTTNFQSIGSISNAVNTIFRATAAGSGTGVAQEISNQVQIWEALFDNTDKDPRHHRKYWKRIDLCGKSLTSCKIRFQGNASDDTLDSAVPLPFGGFPGSKKFK